MADDDSKVVTAASVCSLHAWTTMRVESRKEQYVRRPRRYNGFIML